MLSVDMLHSLLIICNAMASMLLTYQCCDTKNIALVTAVMMHNTNSTLILIHLDNYCCWNVESTEPNSKAFMI